MTNSKEDGENEMGRAFLATNQIPENKEAGQENDSQSRKDVPGEVTLGETEGGSGWRVMTNPITMDKIANFLSDKDLVALCLTNKTTKKIVDQMDSSCWRKRACKLEAVLRLDASVTIDSTSYKERYLILKFKVERLANTIRAKIDENFGRITVSSSQDSKYFSLQELASTASLIHHDMLVEVSCKCVCLTEVNLSSIPIQHLGSLAACVTDQVFFGGKVTIPDLQVLLDKVKCDKLTFLDQTLGTEESLALVRAMQRQTGVGIVVLIHTSVDVRALRNFDGEGRCEQVWFVRGDSFEDTGGTTEDNIRMLAETIDWGVTVIDESIIIHREMLGDDDDIDYDYDEDVDV